MSGNGSTPIAMSNYITPAYTFSPGPSGVGFVNLSGISDFDIKRLVAIVNQTQGVIIYSSANSSYNYTNVVGKVVTLKFDTSDHSPTDILQIVYDTGYTVLDPTFPINIDSIYVSNEVEIKNDEGNPIPVTGPLTDAQLRATAVPVSGPLTDTQLRATPVPVSGTVSANQAGTWNINNVSGTVSLPTGAATENTSLAISGKLPATLGQKTSLNSMAVTIASDQSAVPASQSGTWNINNVSGTVSLPTNAATETTSLAISGKLPATLGQKTSLNSLAVTIASDQSAVPASQSGTWNINNVSGTVSLPTGAATLAAQNTGNSSLSSIDTKTPSLGQTTMTGSTPVVIASNQTAVPVSGPLTDTQLRATPVPVSGTISATQSGTWNINNISGTVSLPTGAATLAAQNTGNASLSSIDGKTPALGQTTMSGSVPVTLASNQPAITVTGPLTDTQLRATAVAVSGPLTDSQLRATPVPVSGTVSANQAGTWNINNISGTVSLPTGAATLGAQNTGNASLSSIDGKVPSLGQALMASSVPVTLASNQPAISVTGPLTDTQLRATPVPVSGTVAATQSGTWNINNISGTVSLPTGAATAAKQDTQSAQLTAINNSINNLGIEVSTPQDILGVGVMGSRYNQLEINFETAPGATLVTETFTGGGAVTITNGHSIYSTGTAATASAQVTTVQSVIYRPAHEMYSCFTAAFTAGTATSLQRIGLFDTGNGFYIGFEGTTFGITKRVSGVNTFIGRASFTNDLLDGGAASRFTRNGVPEAINLSYSNLFRIRFAWLGSAPVVFEVFSPDGQWVTFHTLKIPNSQYDPSIANPNLPMTLQISKTAGDATNITVATACWASGTTADFVKISDTLTANTLATLTRSVITGQTTAGGGGFVNVKVNPSGALNVAATQDGTWNITNISGTVSLPTGAATLAAQNTGNASLSSIDGKTPALGQTTMSGSQPVAIASNQTAIPVTQSGTWNINNISGTVSLPTGAATLAAQNTGNASLSSIDTKTPALGQTTMSGSQPVVIASNQSNVPVAVQDTWKSTYAAAVTNYVPYNNATDILCISGSATKTIRIYRIHISATANPANTVNTNYDIYLVKRSTLNTGDTPTAVTAVPFDSANPAATASVTKYSSAPTLGTTVGTVRQDSLFVSTGAKAGDNPVQPGNYVDMEFDSHPNLQPITLRGVNECVCINFGGITIAANMEIDIVWTEE